MGRIAFILSFLALFITLSASATVEYLTVNHLTKEFYWAETDHGPGIIGWESVNENVHPALEAYQATGYTETHFPFKIEVGLFIVLLLVAVFIGRARKEIKKEAVQPSTKYDKTGVKKTSTPTTYVNVFETTNRLAYYQAAEYLSSLYFDVQKLHEFRLDEDSYHASEPAYLRVPEKDFDRAYSVLIDGGFVIDENYDSKNVQGHKWSLKAQSNRDREWHQSELQSFVGQSINKVFYIIANPIQVDYNTFHSVDVGIVLEFKGGKYLSWNFVEDDFQLPERYKVYFENKLHEADKSFKIIDVSGYKQWLPFINQPITTIRLYSQPVFESKILTDLVLQTEQHQFAFFSSAEPTLKDAQTQVDFIVSNEWTIVVFDEETIRRSCRLAD